MKSSTSTSSFSSTTLRRPKNERPFSSDNDFPNDFSSAFRRRSEIIAENAEEQEEEVFVNFRLRLTDSNKRPRFQSFEQRSNIYYQKMNSTDEKRCSQESKSTGTRRNNLSRNNRQISLAMILLISFSFLTIIENVGAIENESAATPWNPRKGCHKVGKYTLYTDLLLSCCVVI